MIEIKIINFLSKFNVINAEKQCIMTNIVARVGMLPVYLTESRRARRDKYCRKILHQKDRANGKTNVGRCGRPEKDHNR